LPGRADLAICAWLSSDTPSLRRKEEKKKRRKEAKTMTEKRIKMNR
jgi:hypothetical protein